MYKTTLKLSTLLLSSFMLFACGDQEDSGVSAAESLSVDMNLPDSLTGGGNNRQQKASAPLNKETALRKMQQVSLSADASTDEPCFFNSTDEEDPFRNGYQTTKFMVSIMSTWTCITDMLIEISAVVPHDGQMRETENNIEADNYQADEPTHYSVSDQSETQTTIDLYYGYTRSSPPVAGEAAQFYISWNKASETDYQGRLIIDASEVNPEDREDDDPVMMRMDFNFSSSTQTADMFLKFDENNQWADGMRINISKDLNANPVDQVYIARGLISMNAQFLPVASITEIPQIQLFTVSDGFGNGAAIAEFQDISLPLELNQDTANHLGNYLFSKKDIYFFSFNQNWEYINKTVISSEFRGSRTTPASGGSWVPFDPSIDLLIAGMSLDADYFSGNKCASEGDDCTALLNAVFDYTDGFADQEPNQGNDPADWRSDAINTAAYLDSVYPNGINWNNAFNLTFAPDSL